MLAAWGEVITRSLFHVPACFMPSSSLDKMSLQAAREEEAFFLTPHLQDLKKDGSETVAITIDASVGVASWPYACACARLPPRAHAIDIRAKKGVAALVYRMAEGSYINSILNDPVTLIGLGAIAAGTLFYLYTRPSPIMSKIPLDNQSLELPVSVLVNTRSSAV